MKTPVWKTYVQRSFLENTFFKDDAMLRSCKNLHVRILAEGLFLRPSGAPSIPLTARNFCFFGFGVGTPFRELGLQTICSSPLPDFRYFARAGRHWNRCMGSDNAALLSCRETELTRRRDVPREKEKKRKKQREWGRGREIKRKKRETREKTQKRET